MISSSTSIAKVVKNIYELNPLIFEDPIIFEGYVKDIYSGNYVIIDDFIMVLRSLSNRITNHTIDSYVINTACKCINNRNCISVQTALFSIIYVNKNFKLIDNLEIEIKNAYNLSPNLVEEQPPKVKANQIIEFKASFESEVQYGKIIHLSWICKNPVKLILSNSKENMDVTSITAIDLSVTSDVYELLLYDNTGRIIDKSEIKIQYRKNSFCMFCGTPIYDMADIYCTHCGVKL